MGLGHHFGGDDTILDEVVRDTGELTSVANRVLEEPYYLLVIDSELACLDDPFEEEVRLLQLVPEEGVVLREEEGA